MPSLFITSDNDVMDNDVTIDYYTDKSDILYTENNVGLAETRLPWTTVVTWPSSW